jgi:hypothetical protein
MPFDDHGHLKLPPSWILELGNAHGGFVTLMH